MRTLIACLTLSFLAVPALAEKPTVLLAAMIEDDAVATGWLREQGYPVIRVERAYAELNRVLFGIDEPIPKWVDDALRKDWKEGSEACQAKIGPPPYGGNQRAIYCGMDLVAALWQRHVERIAPAGVVLVLGEQKDRSGWRITGKAYEVGSEKQRELTRELKSARDVEKVVQVLCKRLLAGEGKASTRKLVRALPQRPAGSTFNPAARTPQFRPVPLTGCAKLPATLKITPDSEAGRAFAARWKASATGANAAGAERACELRYESSSGEVAFTTMMMAKIDLRCGEDTFSVRTSSYTESSVMDAATKKLVEQAAKKWCE